MRGIGTMFWYWTAGGARGGPLVPKSFPESLRIQKGFYLQFVRLNCSFISCCCAGSIREDHCAEGLGSTGALSETIYMVIRYQPSSTMLPRQTLMYHTFLSVTVLQADRLRETVHVVLSTRELGVKSKPRACLAAN